MKTAFLFILLAPALAAHAAIPLKGDQGSVNFLAVGRPSALKIHGKAPGPEAKLSLEADKLTGTAVFEMEKLETGIALRDQHMKEKYLEVKEHPKAKLTLLEAAVDPGFQTSLSNGGEKTFKGKLELHGKENNVEGKFTAKGGVVEAQFQLKLSDYGIAIPTYLGITMAEVVDVSVELPLKKE